MRKQNLFALITASVLLTLMPGLGLADWSLDGANSSVNFESTKNGQVTESHSFKKLKGRIENSGVATLVIDLGSVDTMIPIRDERIRTMLFNTKKFPKAVIRVDLELATFNKLKLDSSVERQIKGNLTLNGVTQEVDVTVSVLKSKYQVVVASVEPIVIDAADWDLGPGIESLRAIANLTSITTSVPVSFKLQYNLNLD